MQPGWKQGMSHKNLSWGRIKPQNNVFKILAAFVWVSMKLWSLCAVLWLQPMSKPPAQPSCVQPNSHSPCAPRLFTGNEKPFPQTANPKALFQLFLIPNGMLGPQKQHPDFVRSFLWAIYLEKEQALTGVQAKTFPVSEICRKDVNYRSNCLPACVI